MEISALPAEGTVMEMVKREAEKKGMNRTEVLLYVDDTMFFLVTSY